MWAIALAAALTIANRVRCGLQELAAAKRTTDNA
jgi:hypothetical protein